MADRLAYEIALEALRAGAHAVCIPGLDGATGQRAVVVTRRPLRRQEQQLARSGDLATRQAWIVRQIVDTGREDHAAGLGAWK